MRMIKWTFIAIAAIIALGLYSSMKSSTPVVTSAPVTLVPTQKATLQPIQTPVTTATTTPTATPDSTQFMQPAIKGSAVYDIILSLEDKGIPKAKAQSTKDNHGNTVWQYTSENTLLDGTFVLYNITCNADREVSYAVFNTSNSGESWFLPFCASMPYDQAETSQAAKWVSDNIKKEATTQIGDAIFAITPNQNGGAMLTITAAGYEEWCLDQI